MSLTLPDDIWTVILSYFEGDIELLKLQLVCNQWKRIVCSETLWRYKCCQKGWHNRPATKTWRDFYFPSCLVVNYKKEARDLNAIVKKYQLREGDILACKYRYRLGYYFVKYTKKNAKKLICVPISVSYNEQGDIGSELTLHCVTKQEFTRLSSLVFYHFYKHLYKHYILKNKIVSISFSFEWQKETSAIHSYKLSNTADLRLMVKQVCGPCGPCGTKGPSGGRAWLL